MKLISSWNLEGLSILGKLGFEGLFYIHVLQLYSLVDRFQLGGPHKGFSPSASVSSSITHPGVILRLHLSSLTL